MPRYPDIKKSVQLFALFCGLCLSAFLLVQSGQTYLYHTVEQEAFTTRPAGTMTPDSLGVPSQQLRFASGPHMLRASFVQAKKSTAPALMIFHGDDEEISQWAPVQKRLYERGISTFVFDYSGYGASTGRPSVLQIQQDGRIAYQHFVKHTQQASTRSVLGFSLGTAALLDVVNDLKPAPARVVLAGAFTTAREAAVSTGVVSKWIAWALPNVWNNEARIQRVQQPLLIVHSRSDEVIPFEHAQRLNQAASEAHTPHQLMVLDALPHEAPILPQVADQFWQPVLAYLQPITPDAEASEPSEVVQPLHVASLAHSL